MWGATTQEVQDAYVHSMEERFLVLQYCDNHWKAQAIATANYLQWYIYHKAKMEAEAAAAEANRNHVKDDESCIKLARKRSKATIDVNALDTTDSDIEAGRTKGSTSKTSIEVIEDAQPSQREEPQVASRSNMTVLKDPLCDKCSLPHPN